MDPLKQLPRLLVFSCVAKNGSFTKAAAELNLTKSAISQQITSLETELGVRLLNRTTRGLSLTALGEKLLPRCHSLKDQADLIFSDISNAENNPQGKFAITYPHALEKDVVLPALEQLCIEYPGLQPTLIVNDESMDIIEHNLDLAVHAGDLSDSSYRALSVGSMTEIFCATPLFLQRYGTPTTITELEALAWISASWQRAHMPVWQADNIHAKIKLHQFAQGNTLPNVLDLALRHMGFILLPDQVARPLLNSGEFVHIMQDLTGPRWPVYTLHAYQQDKPIHITRFHQLVCQFFNR